MVGGVVVHRIILFGNATINMNNDIPFALPVHDTEHIPVATLPLALHVQPVQPVPSFREQVETIIAEQLLNVKMPVPPPPTFKERVLAMTSAELIALPDEERGRAFEIQTTHYNRFIR